MHELVRTNGKYTIARHHRNNLATVAQFSSGLWPLEIESELDKGVWRQFVNKQNSDHDYIKTSVAQSWDRCHRMGVDPGLKRCRDFRDENNVDAEYQFLRDVVKNIALDFSAFLKDKNLLFTISDRHGYLAGTIGSYKALRKADSIYFGPGANWSEQSVGTNAIGTSLASGLPLRVIGAEHYCESHHGWICSAAPIFGVNGVMQGCVDISGPMNSDHNQSLALAVYCAKAIEALLFQRQCMGMIGQVLNKTAIGLLTLNRHGRICYANNVAVELFGGSQRNLAGRDASKWFDLSPFSSLQTGQVFSGSDEMIELHCLHNPTWNIFAAPLVNNFHHLQGLTLCIYPPIPVSPKRHGEPSGEMDAFAGITGKSAAMQRVLKKGRRVAATDTTVLLTGPSGTGKEVMARALHLASPRAKKPFVAVNCGAIAPDLIQSELFGYVEGAFTGARRGGQPGKFEQATGGSLFLDEIGEMPLSIQVNLLRVLDEKQVVRVGGKESIELDVRVIAATNRDIGKMVAAGTFRQDLYYRLHVFPLHLPPLCEREDDVQLLADSFIKEFSQTFGQRIDEVEPGFRQALAAYSWPGNVRELRHVIESTIILMDDAVLRLESLPDKIQQAAQHLQVPDKEAAMHFTSLNFNDIQKQALSQALELYEGNISQVAKALGIGRNTTYAKLKKFNLL